jgi:hypothetical protein
VTLGRYVLVVVAVALLALVLAWPLVLGRLDEPARLAAGYGAALAILNAVAAYALVHWSDRRSTRAFLGAVLWGMLGRMGLLLGGIVLGVLALGLPQLPLAASLLALFAVYLVLEVAVVHRRRLAVPEAGR